jgi:hypothetical protein
MNKEKFIWSAIAVFGTVVLLLPTVCVGLIILLTELSRGKVC